MSEMTPHVTVQCECEHIDHFECGGLTLEWKATVWRGSDRSNVVAEVTGPTHWDTAAEVDGATI